MKRREFLTRVVVLAGSASVGPFVGACQGLPFASAPRRSARVGFLTGSGADPTTAMRYELFRSTMAQYGWVEGDSLTLELRYPADGNLWMHCPDWPRSSSICL